MTHPRLQEESSGDCPRGCGRAAYPRAIPGINDGYCDACDECAAIVVRDTVQMMGGRYKLSHAQYQSTVTAIAERLADMLAFATGLPRTRTWDEAVTTAEEAIAAICLDNSLQVEEP